MVVSEEYMARRRAFRGALARAEGCWSEKSALRSVLEAADQVFGCTFVTRESLGLAGRTMRLIAPFARARPDWSPYATRKQIKDFDCSWRLHEQEVARQKVDWNPPPAPSHDEILGAFGGGGEVRETLRVLDDLLSTAHDGAFLDIDAQFQDFVRDARAACPTVPVATLEALAGIMAGRVPLSKAPSADEAPAKKKVAPARKTRSR